MRHKLKILAVISSSLLAVATEAQAAELINGSFEQPGGNNRPLGANDAHVTGWVTGVNGLFYTKAPTFGISAGDGTYYISFGLNGTVVGTLSQTFDTIVGQTYRIDYLLRQQGGVGDLQTLVAEIVGGPSVINTALPVTEWGSGLTLNFAATATKTTLRFRDATPRGGGGTANYGLDAVTINAVPSAVPEPATWALMLGGIGAIGGTLRRRSRIRRVFA